MAKKAKLAKASAQCRTLNNGYVAPNGGASFNEQDPKRRLGNFNGAGEHSRKGSRTAGIVGQRKQKFTTDKHG